jgi:hypothetical protein
MRSNPWYLEVRRQFNPAYRKTGSIFNRKFLHFRHIKKTRWETVYRHGKNIRVENSQQVNTMLCKKLCGFPPRWRRSKRQRGAKIDAVLWRKVLQGMWASQDEAVRHLEERNKED